MIAGEFANCFNAVDKLMFIVSSGTVIPPGG